MSDVFERDETEGLPEFLRDPIGMLRRRWVWMLTALGLGFGASAVVYWMIKPTYYAEASVLLARQQLSEELVEPTVEDDALSRVDGIVGEMLASPNLAELIGREGLYPSLEAEGKLDAAIVDVRSRVSIAPGESVTRTRRGGAAQVYLIGFEADQPERAAEMANVLADAFVAASLSTRLRLHKLASDFLRHELERASSDLREQSRKIAEFKQAHRGALPGDLQANLIKLDRLQQQRHSLVQQIAEAEGRVFTLSSTGGAEASPDARLEALRTELRQMEGTRTEKHPDVQTLKHEIASLERQLSRDAEAAADTALPSRATLRQAAYGTVGRLQSQVEETEREITELEDRVDQTPIHEEQLASFEEKEVVLRENYFEFLRKLQDAELAENLQQEQQAAHATVLSRALAPSNPLRAPWKYAAIGVLASFVLALGVGLLLETVDPVLISARQVERIGTPVIGSIGRIT